MISSLYSLIFFTGWTIILVLVVAGFRVAQVLAGKKKSNEFPAWTQHGSDFYWRIHRAHVNCIESLPVFAVLVLIALDIGYQSHLFDVLSMIVCGGRVLQTTAHLSGGGEWNVNVRFTGFLIQYACFAYMLVILLQSVY
ncbi:MAPEG family protein [Leptospira semungkisensis]|uniref:MAPEG family protein n=1 Tax=Leptospira semungkisensis TaxID=2484985 RepID=A0A4R9G5C7_9LEPT|nr:MAPEG family protein [Leptospira semungkisensis]TGK06756.1 MAPEG family protein [Leptospira semungkisensis]